MVTTIGGLFITDLCENKIAVSCDVQTEMDRLRGEGKFSLSVTTVYPVYNASQISFKACFLKRGRDRMVNLLPPYFLSQFLPSPYFLSQFLPPP